MTADLIPSDELFALSGNPRGNLSLHPDGTQFGYVRAENGVPNVFMSDLDFSNERQITDDKARGIRGFDWTQDGTHILYSQDKGGDENFRLYITNIETKESRVLTPFDGVQAQTLASSRNHPDSLLVALNLDDAHRHDVYRLQLSDGKLEKVAENDGYSRWIVDRDLNVRGAVRALPDGGCELLIDNGDGKEWRSLLTAPMEDAIEIMARGFPMEFTEDGKGLYFICAVASDTSRLAKLHLDTGELETVVADPEYDVRGVSFDPDTHEPEIVSIAKERMHRVVLNESLNEDLEILAKVHDGDFTISGRDRANRKWIIGFASDVNPGEIYLYDRDTKDARLLFEAAPGLKGRKLANMEPFTYEARDGLKIHGYLTFPEDSERKNLPTVVMVHGGPQYRDTWGYDPWAQLFANRGYLVVKMNYRGSMGYGKKFLFAGDKQWARAMHTDVLDGIDTVIKKGYADPNLIGMYGFSYGGYETMVTVTHDPDLLACAIAGTAPVNLVSFMESLPSYWVLERAIMFRQCGNPETERDLLWERSPLRLANQIKTPLMLVYGERDPRVTIKEPQQIAEALEKNGIDHELHVMQNEGHSQMTEEHQRFLIDRAERFFAQHLGAEAPNQSQAAIP